MQISFEPDEEEGEEGDGIWRCRVTNGQNYPRFHINIYGSTCHPFWQADFP
jgi:hypothetical protein